MARRQPKSEPVQETFGAPEEPPAVIVAKEPFTEEQVEEIKKLVKEQAPPIIEAPSPAANDEQALIRELTDILKVPKSKDALMTFSMYTVGQYTRRYFLLDVDGQAYRKAWEVYKERTGSADATQFMTLVYQILNTDMPRLHRAVEWVPLN